MSRPNPRARVGDADREQTVAALQWYATEGYLSLDEFSDRSQAAYQATTRGELAEVTADLPAAGAELAGRPPGSEPDRPHPATAQPTRRVLSPAVIVVAVTLGGAVLLAVVAMVLMMLGMMGGMEMGGMEMGGMEIDRG